MVNPARVAKLVDAKDLKSLDHCDRAGSIPAPAANTNQMLSKAIHRCAEVYKALLADNIKSPNHGIGEVRLKLLIF